MIGLHKILGQDNMTFVGVFGNGFQDRLSGGVQLHMGVVSHIFNGFTKNDISLEKK